MILLIMIVFSALSFGAYSVGDIVDDASWLDNNGEPHSISELTASGKVVVFFWGSTG